MNQNYWGKNDELQSMQLQLNEWESEFLHNNKDLPKYRKIMPDVQK